MNNLRNLYRDKQRSFLIKDQVTWTDILRQKQRKKEVLHLEEQLKKAKNNEEKESAREAILMVQNEINQWSIS